MKRRFLFEAEDDGTNASTTSNDAGAAADTGSNDTGDTSADNNAEDTTDTNTDNNADDADNNNDDQNDDFNTDDNDDFNIDTGDDNPDDNGDGNDDTTGTTGSMPSSPDDDGPIVSADSLKAKDGEIFDSLEPAEQEMKLKELKEQFVCLYQNCDEIIDRINTVAMEYEQYAETLKRIVNTLFTTKRMISDHILHIFDSKSYHENDIRYTEFLAIINTVKNIIKDLNNGIKDTNSDS